MTSYERSTEASDSAPAHAGLFLISPASTDRFHVMKDGHAVSRVSDFIVYSVEAEYIDKVVAEYGPCTSPHAVLLCTTGKRPTDDHLGDDQLQKWDR